MIEIVYIATNGYCKYAENFFSTLKYFLPNRKKIVTVLSNKMEEYEGFHSDDVLNTKVIKIFDMIYPLLNLQKSYIINQLPETQVDYIFYFDADTMFKEVPNYDWDNFLNEADEGKFFISRHPAYAIKEGGYFYSTPKENFINNFHTSNIQEKDPLRASYIDGKGVYTHIISSFFGGSKECMRRVNEKVIAMTREDLTRNNIYHVPQWMDENYFNRLVYDYDNNFSDEIQFSVKQYSELYNVENDYYDTVFMYQKNMGNFKTNRR